MRYSKQSLALIIGAMFCSGLSCSGKANIDSQPIRVRVQKAERFSGDRAFAYSGTIEAAESTPLSFSVTGTVSRVLVSEGDYVEKGQILAVLNDATMKNAYEMAGAALERAQDAHDRLKPMHDRGNLPEIKFVEAETGLQQAKAAAAIARKNLSDCSLHAPVAGFVGRRSIESGQNVLPGITSISILDMKKVYARVSVSEGEIASIARGGAATITVGALGGRKFAGTVEEIGVQADPISHTYKVKIGIPNDDTAIKPGMICDARIVASDVVSGVVVPNESVRVDENGKTFVFSIDDARDIASRKYVEIGRLLNDGVEIRSGLGEGEMVVVAGQQKLVDNAAVQIVN